MVIGNGFLANRFLSYVSDNRFLIFASGVSNSWNTAETEFEREKDLIETVIENNQSKILIYFSTCSIYDSSIKNSAYVWHKLLMEELIQKQANCFLIFRLSNPVGLTKNKNTFLNYLIDKIASGEKFELWNEATRNLIDVDHVFHITDAIMQNSDLHNQTINIANPISYPVVDIYYQLEKHFKKQGNYTIVNRGEPFNIDTETIKPFIGKLSINFDTAYIHRLLQKYFPINDL